MLNIKLYELKHSHHGLAETMQVKNLLNPTGFLLLGENIPDHCANTCCGLIHPIMSGAFARPSTLCITLPVLTGCLDRVLMVCT